MYELKPAEYSESEKRVFRICVILELLYSAFFMIYLISAGSLKPIGVFYPYIFLSIDAAIILDLAAYIIFFFVSVIKIKYYRVIQIFIIAGLTAISIIPIYLSRSSFQDILTGPERTVTNKYKIISYMSNAVDTEFHLKFISEKGEYTVIYIPEDVAKMLGENPETGKSTEENVVLVMPLHRNNIKVEYYGCSEVFIGVKIEE